MILAVLGCFTVLCAKLGARAIGVSMQLRALVYTEARFLVFTLATPTSRGAAAPLPQAGERRGGRRSDEGGHEQSVPIRRSQRATSLTPTPLPPAGEGSE